MEIDMNKFVFAALACIALAAAAAVEMSVPANVEAQTPNNGARPKLFANMTATAVVISSYPTTVSTVSCANTDTSNAFVQFFNSAAPTVGTTTPLASIMVPAGGGNNAVVSVPWTFDVALSIAGTSTVNGSSNPTASTLHCTIATRAAY